MIFSPEELKMKVEDSLNGNDVHIPAGHKGALVTYTDEHAVHIAIVSKVGVNWQVQGNLSISPVDKDKFDPGVSIVRTW